jgi:hypothetical protein
MAVILNRPFGRKNLKRKECGDFWCSIASPLLPERRLQMRPLILLGAFFVTISSAIPGAAQYILPGDYVQTCRNISTYGNRMEAECQRRDGSWRRTTLNNIDQCSYGIINNDGRLTCAGGDYGYYQGGWQNGLPSGDYVQTCRNMRTYGNRLEAECQKRNGGWRRTALDNIDQCSSPIANDNGHLVCGRGGPAYGGGWQRGPGYGGGWQNGLPSGDYVQTCRNIRTSGNRLEAECQKRNGDWRWTSLDRIDQCSSPIANDDGNLVCNRGDYGYNPGWQGGVPAGTYTQTCRNVRVYGNRLEAECQKRDGGWRRTALDNFDQCRSAPANDDGNLVCGR